MNRQRAKWFFLVLPVIAIAFATTRVRAADPDAINAPRIAGTLTFTCVPDAKSATAGAKSFEDELELGDDRAKSKTLSAEGFPAALSIPKVVNGVPSFNIVFKKTGATATYFIRAKPGGEVSGSLTRVEGGRTLRYAIGASAKRAEQEGAASRPSAAGGAAMSDDNVLRINGGFVRLMAVQVAMADAGVSVDKAKLGAILQSVAHDHNALQASLVQGSIKPSQFVERGEAALAKARRDIHGLLGDKAAVVEKAEAAPFAATYAYLNQMRAAVTETGGDDAKRADHVVYEAILELTKLARQKDKLTPTTADALKDRAKAAVTKTLAEPRRDRFETTLAGMAAYSPSAGAAAAPTKAN